MLKPSRLVAFALFALSLAAGRAAAECSVARIEMPVTMSGLRAMIPAQINGADTIFAVDSGAFFSVISPAKAAQFHLHLNPLPSNFTMMGLGGVVDTSLTTVDKFTVMGVPIHNVQFLVGGSAPGQDVAGLLGQNFLGLWDVEYDLANGAIRLMRPSGCEHKEFAYWAKPNAYSVMNIETANLNASSAHSIPSL